MRKAKYIKKLEHDGRYLFQNLFITSDGRERFIEYLDDHLKLGEIIYFEESKIDDFLYPHQHRNSEYKILSSNDFYFISEYRFNKNFSISEAREEAIENLIL
jgi:hypothetical protein